MGRLFPCTTSWLPQEYRHLERSFEFVQLHRKGGKKLKFWVRTVKNLKVDTIIMEVCKLVWETVHYLVRWGVKRTSKASNGTHGRWKICQEELAVWFDNDFLSFLFFHLLFLIPAAERGFTCFVVFSARVRSPGWLIRTVVPAVCFLLRLTMVLDLPT